MSPEEFQNLIKWLRDMQYAYGQSWQYGAIADEIERLERELQATLELLYQESERRVKAEHELKLRISAGLIEAAEWHEQRRRDTPDVFEKEFHDVSAKHFRRTRC